MDLDHRGSDAPLPSRWSQRGTIVTPFCTLADDLWSRQCQSERNAGRRWVVSKADWTRDWVTDLPSYIHQKQHHGAMFFNTVLATGKGKRTNNVLRPEDCAMRYAKAHGLTFYVVHTTVSRPPSEAYRAKITAEATTMNDADRKKYMERLEPRELRAYGSYASPVKFLDHYMETLPVARSFYQRVPKDTPLTFYADLDFNVDPTAPNPMTLSQWSRGVLATIRTIDEAIGALLRGQGGTGDATRSPTPMGYNGEATLPSDRWTVLQRHRQKSKGFRYSTHLFLKVPFENVLTIAMFALHLLPKTELTLDTSVYSENRNFCVQYSFKANEKPRVPWLEVPWNRLCADARGSSVSHGETSPRSPDTSDASDPLSPRSVGDPLSPRSVGDPLSPRPNTPSEGTPRDSAMTDTSDEHKGSTSTADVAVSREALQRSLIEFGQVEGSPVVTMDMVMRAVFRKDQTVLATHAERERDASYLGYVQDLVPPNERHSFSQIIETLRRFRGSRWVGNGDGGKAMAETEDRRARLSNRKSYATVTEACPVPAKKAEKSVDPRDTLAQLLSKVFSNGLGTVTSMPP